jgi:hypothetical protein
MGARNQRCHLPHRSVEPSRADAHRYIRGLVAIAAGEGSVWVINRVKGTITCIDEETNTAAEPVDLHGKPSAVVVGEGSCG